MRNVEGCRRLEHSPAIMMINLRIASHVPYVNGETSRTNINDNEYSIWYAATAKSASMKGGQPVLLLEGVTSADGSRPNL